MANPIVMTSKLLECRDAAKGLYREEFPQKIKPYSNLIKAVMQRHQLDVLPAVLKITTETDVDSGYGTMMFMAAAVELIEESAESEKQTKE